MQGTPGWQCLRLWDLMGPEAGPEWLLWSPSPSPAPSPPYPEALLRPLKRPRPCAALGQRPGHPLRCRVARTEVATRLFMTENSSSNLGNVERARRQWAPLSNRKAAHDTIRRTERTRLNQRPQQRLHAVRNSWRPWMWLLTICSFTWWACVSWMPAVCWVHIYGYHKPSQE